MTAVVETTTEAVSVLGKGKLAGMLADLALTTDPSDERAWAQVVRLHVDGGRLHGWASDGYTAAHAVLSTKESHLAEPVHLLGTDVKRIHAMFRASMWVDFTVNRQEGRVEFTDHGSRLAVPYWDDVDYPPLWQACKEDVPEQGPVTSLDPKYVERFCKIAKRRKESMVVVSSEKLRPVHVRIGDDYRGWLMPRERTEDGLSWLSHSV